MARRWGRTRKGLHERVHTGGYRPQPVKRQWIDKADGGTRPLGITCVEDKIVQQALVWILPEIYEQDFLGLRYGFRPGRSQHRALDALYLALTVKKVGFVLDMDIQGFYDHIDPSWLRRFVEHRIADRRMLEIIGRTLQVGVIDEGRWTGSTLRVPQGSVISPLLANSYLHYALDQWAHHWRQRSARGEVYFIRYADEVVACFQRADDGQRFWAEVAQRLDRFGLSLHPDKTRLLKCGRFAAQNRRPRGEGKPESFDFLGFTHVCARRWSYGRFTVRRLTIAKRQRRKLKEIGIWVKRNRTIPVAGNYGALNALRTEICKLWLRALRRRSHKAAKLTWARFQRFVRQWLPRVRLVHPYPSERLHV